MARVVEHNVLENKIRVRLFMEKDKNDDGEEKLTPDIYTYKKEEIKRVERHKDRRDKKESANIFEGMDAETMKDDNLSQALSVMKKYSGADELTQAMVQELIEKVIVTDPEHVEIVWKFKDEVRKFIEI